MPPYSYNVGRNCNSDFNINIKAIFVKKTIFSIPQVEEIEVSRDRLGNDCDRDDFHNDVDDTDPRNTDTDIDADTDADADTDTPSSSSSSSSSSSLLQIQPYTSPSNPFSTQEHGLQTIPERRVVFAGTIVGDAIFDAVEVFPVYNRLEYSVEDKRRMWYTETELERIKENCFDIAELVLLDPSELYSPLYFRGLEHLIDESYKDYRWNGICAVLEEQDRQRKRTKMKLGSHHQHAVGHPLRMTTDPERIRSVYSKLGRTRETKAIAQWIALLDASIAREISFEDGIDDETVGSVDKGYSQQYYNGNFRPKSDDDFFAGVRGVFRRLLTPFLNPPILDIREGNIYVGIGEVFNTSYTFS